MPFTASFDNTRKIISFEDAPSGSSILVNNANGKLVFSLTPATGAVVTSELVVSSFAGFTVPAGVVLTVDASLANGKAMFGNGDVVARARINGEDLSGYNLFVDRILLSDGASYSLSASQALMAQIGPQGSLGDLRSSNSNSKINLIANAGTDLSGIAIDRNDTVLLTAGQSYTLSCDQALVAKVGLSGVADLTGCSAVLIKAPLSLDLSSIKTDVTDVLELGAGKDYVLTSSQASSARVGPSGVLGAVGAAGSITVKASANGEDLSMLKASGVDVFELTAGKNYTLTAEQTAASRVGPTGTLGHTVGAGQLIIKAGTLSDLTRLPTKVVTDTKGVADLTKSDVLILEANIDYRLTSEQARVAKVGMAATAKTGDFSAAGQITLVTGLTANSATNSRTEDLSVLVLKGVDSYELAPNVDYVLTSQQAKVAKVAAGALGNLAAAGNITLVAQLGENLTLSPIVGVDEYRLTAAQTYTVSAEQAFSSRVMVNGVLGGYGDVSGTKTTIVAGAQNNLTRMVVDSNDAILLTAGVDYTLTSLQASIARIDESLAGSLAKAGTVTIAANPKGEDLSLSLATVTGIDSIVLTAGGKYGLTSDQAKISTVFSPVNGSGLVGAAENMPNTVLPVTASSTGTVNAGVQGTVFVQYAYSGSVPVAFKATFVAQLTNNITNWQGWEVGRDITAFVSVTGGSQNSTVVIATGAGLSSAPIVLQVTGMISPWNGVSVGLNNTISQLRDLTNTGQTTIVANALGEDLSSLTVPGVKAYQLASGRDYVLTAEQALIARLGPLGVSGDLVGSVTTPGTTGNTGNTGGSTSGAGKTGVITIVGSSNNFDFTRLKTDANDLLVLLSGNSHRLTTAQAATAKIGNNGVLGQLTNPGVITVVADTNNTDLSNLVLDGGDRIELISGQNYTLLSSQLPMVRVGGVNSLVKAGAVTVIVNAQDGNITGINLPGIDVYQLPAASDYVLRLDQAAISRVGTTGALGDFSLVSGSVAVRVDAATVTPLDLTALTLKDTDNLQLVAGSNYILTPRLAAVATVMSGSTISTRGDLSTAGTIVIRPAAAGADLTTLLADIRGVDRIELDPEGAYTLSDAQARIAAYGKSGAVKDLVSKSPKGMLNVIAGDTAVLTDLQLDANDKIILQPGKPYTLTLEQALISQVGLAGVPAALGNNADGNMRMTVQALRGADLTRLQLDANDELILGVNQRYTLSSAQAQIAWVDDSVSSTGIGNFANAGAVRIIASATGEDLTAFVLDTNDTLQLAAGTSYTITAAQASNAVIGTLGVKGRLTGAGVITVKAGAQSDLTGLLLDTNGALTLMDSLQLDVGQNYTLASNQAAIAKVGASGVVGQLAAAGNLTLAANPAGEDLSLTLALVTGLDAQDRITLARVKNYTLTKEQLAIAQVGNDPLGDLSSAGVITLKSQPGGSTEDLSTVAAVAGVDRILLKSGTNTTLTDEQASMAQLGLAKVQDLRGTEIITIKSNDLDADLSQILTDSSDMIWLAPARKYTLNSAQVPRISFDGQTIASASNVTGQFTLMASNQGEDLSSINTNAIDLIQLTAGRNYTLTPEQARIATTGGAMNAQNFAQTLSGTGMLYKTPAGTQNYTTQVQIDTSGYISGGTINMRVILGNGNSAGSYDLFKNNITLGGVDNRPTNSLANAYDVAPGSTTNLSYSFPGSTTDKYIFGITGNWLSPANASNTFSYQITVAGERYSPNLSKAGVINIQASADGDLLLKSKLAGISGIDAITLTDSKDYNLSAAQALIAKIGNALVGTLTSTGAITVDDTGVAAGTRQNLTKLVLDNNDSLVLGAGDYELTSMLVRKADNSLANAGVVNLMANPMGEDLYGIIPTALDNIFLTASRDYTLSTNQLAKTKVGTTGTFGNLTKAGVVTLKLAPSEINITALNGVNGVKGVDQIQVLDANTALISFLRNTTSSSTGSSNTGSNATVDAAGEWAFVNSTDRLTYWNGSASQTVTLVGVSNVAADGTTALKIGY